MMFFVFLKSLVMMFSAVTILSIFAFGVIKAIDYIEEKAHAAKKHIKRTIEIIVGLHVIFFFRGISILHILFSLSLQYAFYCLLDNYPFVKMDDPYFVYGIIGSLLNHFLFIRAVFTKHWLRGAEIVLSFVAIWVVPGCFLISLSANDDALFVKGKTTSNTLIGQFLRKYVHGDRRRE